MPSTRKRTAQGPAAAAHSSTKRNRHDPITIEAPCAAFANNAYLSNMRSIYENKQLTDVVIITTNRVNKKEEKITAHRHESVEMCVPECRQLDFFFSANPTLPRPYTLLAHLPQGRAGGGEQGLGRQIC